jgi:hypothetical protein
MTGKTSLTLVLLACSFFTFACVYIVLPEGLEAPEGGDGAGAGVWTALVTQVGEADTGGLHIDITLRNDTGDWSTLEAVAGKPAVLVTADGNASNCDTVFVSTGGHRLAPGFQMRGYITSLEDPLTPQLLYVECSGATDSAGAKLSIKYLSFTGLRDNYDPEAGKAEGTLELNLDEVAADLTYPIATPVEGLALVEPGTGITALSDNVVTLLEAQRTETGFAFNWQNFNPTKFALQTHIGTPPVIGSDGIIYGPFETLDIVSVPITPAKENMQWTTEVAAPADVTGFYILLSVESNKPRTYLNYALNIGEQ